MGHVTRRGVFRIYVKQLDAFKVPMILHESSSCSTPSLTLDVVSLSFIFGAILVGKHRIIMIKSHIFLMSNEAELLFKFVQVVGIYYLVTCLFRSFAHISVGLSGAGGGNIQMFSTFLSWD